MSIRSRTWFLLGVVVCLLGATVVVARSFVISRNSTQQPDAPPPVVQIPRNPVTPGPSDKSSKPLFDELTAEATGVRFEHRLVDDHPLAYLYHSGFQCGGVCLGDVDGDGLADILLISGPDENGLFINQGGMRFEKSPASKQLSDGQAWGVGASLSDVDGDGDLDVFVSNYDSPNRLWLNQGRDSGGQLQFTECRGAGLSYKGPSHTPYFADFDVDGDLDLFLLTNRLHSPTGRPKEVASELGPDGQPRVQEKYAPYLRVVDPELEVPGPGDVPVMFMLEYGYEDRLYLNEGLDSEGVPRFTDVTADSGLENVVGHGLSALVWDINQDHRPDIYVANDYTDPDRLWLNLGADEGGAVRFRDATDEFLPYTTWFSMGSDVADVNNDGRLDFMVADMAATTHFKAKSTMGDMKGWRRWVLENGWPRQAMRNMLFVDSGAGRFREAGLIAGVASSDWTWAVKFADFDLDGRNDLFLTNGAARMFSDSDVIVRPHMLVGQTEWDIFRDKPEMRETNMVFRNLDGQRFQNESRPWQLDKEGMSFGAATGDLDGDGDLDLVVCNLTENVSIYRNNAADDGSNWLRIKLEDQTNRFGLGALVTVTFADGSSQVRLMNPQTGFLSGNEPVLHFGLGETKTVESLKVRWPDGAVQQLGPQPSNQLLIVQRSKDAAPETPEVQPRHFIEVAKEVGLEFTHEETRYDDFQREFLLPGRLSQFGPGIAVADVNGDQLDDVFVGGAAGQSAALFFQQSLPPSQGGGPTPGFQRLENAPWDADAASEDMGALLFDADRDGDLDLYVARGSNEWDPGDVRYEDGLFLNLSEPEGEIEFVSADAGSIPDMRESASCVVGCDFDRDGDVDLFVGARSVPGSFPLAPNSTLLRNDGTEPGQVSLLDVTKDVAPGLSQAGLVTGALWSDVNRDGWSDLLVTCEWGPVRLFMNQRGKLVESTAAAGLSEKTGWWNSITGADFDGDGDIDYAVGNVGLNTKYGHASSKKPAILYRGDMDADGVYDLVEAKSSKDGELPVRGRSCSCNAMPLLRERFPTYKQFAAADLPGIYSETTLRSSDKLIATEFESGLWMNESTKDEVRFSWKPLPYDAQLSPCFGVVATDLFGEGAPSLAVLQNLYSREPETGIWRAGLGCIFRHDEQSDAPISSVRPDLSGFIVDGDGKGLATADLNADGRPDLLATQNDGALLAFEQQASPQHNKLIAVRLIGPPGNPTGLGARVQLMADDQLCGTTEVYGGSGYLSQSSSTVYLHRPAGPSARIEVTWPEGEKSSVALQPEQTSVLVTAKAP